MYNCYVSNVWVIRNICKSSCLCFVRSQNVITNGELNGVNQLGTYQFGVGSRDRTMDVEYNLPLKLGVYVLTDRNDHIDIDLPITGNIESPEFSYRKIIMKAIGNLLLKVAAAPFEWMTPDKQDAFRHIDIGVLDPGLSSEHYARLDNMAAALKSDSTIHVRLTQRVNYNRASRRIADLNLKIAYYNSTQEDSGEFLDMLDFSRIAEMRLSGREVMEFADSQLLLRGIDPTNMTTHAKAMALYGDKIDGQLMAVINMRNQTIARYVAFQHKDLPAEKFTVVPVTIEDIKNYTGKDIYSVTLVVGEDEVEVKEDEETTEEPMEDVEEIAGKAVYIEEDNLPEMTLEDDGFAALVGWMLLTPGMPDQLGHDGNDDDEVVLYEVGEITDFFDIPNNPCIEVETENGAVMLPLHEDLILSLDPENLEIIMQIPAGLL